MEKLLQACSRPLRAVLHLYWRFQRPMTLGVRAAVFDSEGRVFLVRHSYVPGWHFPGGGVEAGESLEQALARELIEEGAIALDGRPALHGVYFNRKISARDHVALFIVRAFRKERGPVANREIVAHGFFPVDALPEGTTRATHARLDEILTGAPASPDW